MPLGDFLAFTKILSAAMNTKLNGLADGSLDDDSNKLSLFRLEEQLDHVISGGLASSSGLSLTIASGVAKIGGKRVTFGGGTATQTANKDVYVSVNDAGTLTRQEVANGGTIPTLPSNSIWLTKSVSGASTFSSHTQTGFIMTNGQALYPQGAIGKNQLRSGELNVHNQFIGSYAAGWNSATVTIPNSMAMRSAAYHVGFTIMGESSGGGQGGLRYQPGIAYATSTTTFVIWFYASVGTVNLYLSYTLKEKDNY